MSAPILLGTLGEQMNLLIQKGCLFGPHNFQMFNPDKVTPVDITGFTFEAAITRGEFTYPLTITVVDPLIGRYDLVMDDADTALIDTAECGRYGFSMRMTDSAGNTQQLYFGNATVVGD